MTDQPDGFEAWAKKSGIEPGDSEWFPLRDGWDAGARAERERINADVAKLVDGGRWCIVDTGDGFHMFDDMPLGGGRRQTDCYGSFTECLAVALREAEEKNDGG